MPAFFVPLEEIAALTQGTLLGRPDLVITGVAGLSEAGPGDLSFVTGEAASKEATSTQAIALLVPRPIDGLACAQIVVTNPALAMARVVEKFFVPQRPALGVSNLGSRGKDVVLGEGLSIWPFGTIYDSASIGCGITLYSIGQTIVRHGTKVDNLVQIAHNVEVGEHNILVAQVGIAGSSRTGHHVMVGGQAGIADHVTVGDFAMIAARSGLNRDVPAKEVVAGAPALPRMEWLKAMAIVAKLPELRQQVRDLADRLKALEATTAAKPMARRNPKRKTTLATKPKAKSRKGKSGG